MNQNKNLKLLANKDNSKDILDVFDPLSEFNILSYVTWNDETLSVLSKEWALRGKDGLTLPEFVHVMLKVFPKPDRRNPSQRREWVQKLHNFFIQIDFGDEKHVQWQSFLSFITSFCVFDREKTRVDTVVQYHFEKEITDRSGNFTVLKFLYDAGNDHIISFNANGQVQMYSPSSLSLLKKIQLHGRPINAIYDGAIINERSLLAVCYPTGIQILSTLQGCSLAQDIETPEATHFCIMYDPSTHHLFTGCENGKLHCWRADNWGEKPSRMNWKCSSSIKVTNGSAITCITLIPDSASFATGDEDGCLIVWDRKNIRLIHRIQAHHAPIHSIVHSESLHALITAAYETTVCAWNPFIPFMISKIECPTGVVTAMTCLPDCPHLIMADRNGNMHIVNSRTMSIVQTFTISPYGQFVNRVNLTETSQKQLSRSLLVTGSFPVTALSHCGPRKRFILGGRMIRFYEYEENIQPMLSDRIPIRSAMINHQFHVIATVSGCNIRHWETSNGKMRCVFRKASPTNITAMCYDTPQTVHFIGCHGGELLAIHFPTGQQLHMVGKHSAEITSMHFLKSVSVLVTSGWGGYVTLWQNTPNGRVIDLLTEKKDDILAMAASDKHLMIAAGSDKGDIFIWNLDDIRLTCVLQPQSSSTEILSLTFVEDSSLLVSSDSDGFITFWSVISDDPAPVSQLPNFYIESQTSSILAMCVADRFLITGDHCGEIRLWDISQLIAQYPLSAKRSQSHMEKFEFLGIVNQKGKTAKFFSHSVKCLTAKNCTMPVGSFQLILKWKAHHSPITSLSTFKANGLTIVLTSSNDCSVAVWDMLSGHCFGFLQSNPSFGINDRQWTLKYDPKSDTTISMDKLLSIIEQADSIKTPPDSPR